MRQNNSIYSQVENILNHYKKYESILWNIDTNFYRCIERLLDNFRKCNSFHLNQQIELRENKNENQYQLYLNNQNITPNSNSRPYVALSTMRQYLQIFSALGLIDWNEKLDENCEIYIDQNLINIFNENLSIDQVFYNFALEPIDEFSTKYKRNYSYSFFLILIFYLNKGLFLNLKHKVDLNKKNKEEISQYETNDPRFLSYLEKITIVDKSYEFVQDIIQKSEIDLQEIVLKIYEGITQDNPSPNYYNVRKTLDDIGKYRADFREKLFKRQKEKQIDCDIQNSPPNQVDSEMRYFLEACHIYEVKHVKKNHQNEDERNEHITSANNGLLMNPNCHKLFDRGIIWFDLDGRLRWKNKYESLVKSWFGVEINHICIHEKILNAQMRNYIKKRYEWTNQDLD